LQNSIQPLLQLGLQILVRIPMSPVVGSEIEMSWCPPLQQFLASIEPPSVLYIAYITSPRGIGEVISIRIAVDIK
jgi:hypothetical protein